MNGRSALLNLDSERSERTSREAEVAQADAEVPCCFPRGLDQWLQGIQWPRMPWRSGVGMSHAQGVRGPP